LREELQQQVNKLLPLIETNVFALDDVGIEVAVGRELLIQHKTIATAESCTGGFIAHKITSVPGASQWYRGSIVAYHNDVKEKLLNVSEQTLTNQGAVSEETVCEMAKQVRHTFNSDYAIAVSGVAGPDGGTPEKPVGTVWIAVADAQNVYSRKYQFTRTRLQNIEMTALNALFMLYRVLKANL
jgi:nicotinamide-nucleotide amidase